MYSNLRFLSLDDTQSVVLLEGLGQQQGGVVRHAGVGQAEHLQVGVGRQRLKQLVELLVGNVL